MLDPQELARIQAWAASSEEARLRERENAVVGGFGTLRTIRHLQHEKDEAATQQAEQDAATRAETLRATSLEALDGRHKARELSLWRYSGLGTDEAFEKQWPQRRAELARTEVTKSISATEHSLYRDL